jgi:hypothetical protein
MGIKTYGPLLILLLLSWLGESLIRTPQRIVRRRKCYGS